MGFKRGNKYTGIQKPTSAFRGVAVLNQVHLTMMLVVFLPTCAVERAAKVLG